MDLSGNHTLLTIRCDYHLNISISVASFQTFWKMFLIDMPLFYVVVLPLWWLHQHPLPSNPGYVPECNFRNLLSTVIHNFNSNEYTKKRNRAKRDYI